MKKLILLRGVPGAGKSTFAEYIVYGLCRDVKNATIREFSTDKYFVDANGNYNFNPALLGVNHAKCRSAVDAFLNQEYPFPEAHDYVAIVHNTLTTEKEVAAYVKLAEECGAELISLIVENRHGNTNEHNVPNEAIQRMVQRFSVKLN